MALEALLAHDNLTDSDADGIDGGTDCNFIFILFHFYKHNFRSMKSSQLIRRLTEIYFPNFIINGTKKSKFYNICEILHFYVDP